MSKTILYGMPMHELLKRSKQQGLWPIPEKYHALSTEEIIRRLSGDTGHSIRYVRAILDCGARLDSANWPSLTTDAANITGRENLGHVGRGKFKSRPNPVKRAAIERNAVERQRLISHNRTLDLVEDSTDIRTNAKPIPKELQTLRSNAGALARVADQYAPVLTNGRMRKNSKNTTQFSTGFAPPSRKDDTRSKPNKQPGTYKRFSKT